MHNIELMNLKLSQSVHIPTRLSGGHYRHQGIKLAS